MEIRTSWLSLCTQALGLSEQGAAMHEEEHAQVDRKPRSGKVCLHELLQTLEDLLPHRKQDVGRGKKLDLCLHNWRYEEGPEVVGLKIPILRFHFQDFRTADSFSS